MTLTRLLLPCPVCLSCEAELPSKLHHFCAEHARLDSFCRVQGCTAYVEPGRKTCLISAHRQKEDEYRSQASTRPRTKHAKRNTFRTDSKVTSSGPAAHDQWDSFDEVSLANASATQLCSLPLMLIFYRQASDTEQPAVGGAAAAERAFAEKARANWVARLIASFRQGRSHNEQLSVCTCGVIRGRETFFTSESKEKALVSKPPSPSCVFRIIG